MKNKLLIISTYRNILRQKISYISIVVLLFFGVCVFVGAEFASLRMTEAISSYYDEMSFRDIRIYSPLMLTEDDISAIKGLDGVQDVEPGYFAPAKLTVGQLSKNVRVVSNSAVLNRFTLVDGELPWQDEECLIEKQLADELGIAIGDTIDPVEESGFDISGIAGDLEGTGGFMRFPSYKVTGIVEHPEHFDLKYEYTPYILVNRGGFDSTVLSDIYMTADIRLEGTYGENRYSDSYKDRVSTVCDRIKEISKESYERRFEELNDLYNEYLSKFSSYFEENDEARQKMQQLGEMLDERSDGDWIIATLEENEGYISVGNNSQMLKKLAPAFTGAFLVVAFIMICVMIWKMLNEDRAIIGDMKTNGFSDREIFMPYFCFAISAVLVGSIAGIIVGTFFLERYVNYQFARYYIYDTPSAVLYPGYAVILVLSIIVATFVATYAFANRIGRKSIISLINKTDNVRTPAAGAGSKTKFSLSWIAIRDLRTDLHRIILSVISVAGATMLVIMSFSIRFGIGKTVEYQDQEVIHYDGDILFEKDETASLMGKILEDGGAEYLYIRKENVKIKNDEGSLNALLRVGDLKLIQEYIGVHDVISGGGIDYSDGLYISEKQAKTLGVKAGDKIQIQNETGNIYDVEIGGITDYYLGVEVFMSPEDYKKVFDHEVSYNAIMIKQNGRDFAKQMESLDGYSGFVSSQDDINYYKGYFAAFAAIIYLITGFALAMESVLVLAVVDMQIGEKRRKLKVMRLMGFFDNELKSYLRIESVITCVLGMAAGSILGFFGSEFILDTVSGGYASFIIVPSALCIMIPLVILAVFYIIIYRISFSRFLRIRV